MAPSLARVRGAHSRAAPLDRFGAPIDGWHVLRFATRDGEVEVAARAVVLALGGGSWARLGSDGAWLPMLAARGVDVAPLRPANCGFDIAGAKCSARNMRASR
jgi:predicted flavoprotein YhiN